MTGLRLTNDRVAATASVIGIATILAGIVLAVRGLGQPAPAFIGGHFWGFLWQVHFAVVLGALVLATSQLLTTRRRPAWALVLGVAGLGAALALAVRAADLPVVWGRGEDGVWGALNSLVVGTLFALFLLLPLRSRDRPLGGPSLFGVGAGFVLMGAAIAVGLHQADRPFFSPFWTFVEAAIRPLGFGALLVLTSLPFRTSPSLLWSAALASATIVFVGGLGGTIEAVSHLPNHGGWIFLGNVTARTSVALLILAAMGVLRFQAALAAGLAVSVATVAYAVWFASFASSGFEVWLFFFITTGGLAMAVLIVMCSAISRGEGAADDAQPSDPVAVSAAT